MWLTNNAVLTVVKKKVEAKAAEIYQSHGMVIKVSNRICKTEDLEHVES